MVHKHEPTNHDFSNAPCVGPWNQHVGPCASVVFAAPRQEYPELFPMYTVPLFAVLQMSEIFPHEACRLKSGSCCEA